MGNTQFWGYTPAWTKQKKEKMDRRGDSTSRNTSRINNTGPVNENRKARRDDDIGIDAELGLKD